MVWDKVCLSPVLELLFLVGDVTVRTDNIRAPLDTSPGFSESLSDVSGFLVLVWVSFGVTDSGFSRKFESADSSPEPPSFR